MSTSKPPIIRIKIVEPDTFGKARKRRPTHDEIGIHFDSTQFYAMKAFLERTLGHPIYLKLKDYAPLKEWQKAIIRLLDAMELAINSTVEVADQEWRDDIAEAIQLGRDLIKGSEKIGNLFAVLSATLTQVVFLQIGLMPSRPFHGKTVPLTADFWTLNRHRSVQYVQTAAQRQALDAMMASRRAAVARPADQPVAAPADVDPLQSDAVDTTN
jgi:hypothetical protein